MILDVSLFYVHPIVSYIVYVGMSYSPTIFFCGMWCVTVVSAQHHHRCVAQRRCSGVEFGISGQMVAPSDGKRTEICPVTFADDVCLWLWADICLTLFADVACHSVLTSLY